MSQPVSANKSSEHKVAMLLLFFVGVIVTIGAIAVVYESGHLMALEEIGRAEAIYSVTREYISIAMFLTLAMLLFSGYPVAFILGGLSMLFGVIGYYLDMFSLIEFFNFVPRIWGWRQRILSWLQYLHSFTWGLCWSAAELQMTYFTVFKSCCAGCRALLL